MTAKLRVKEHLQDRGLNAWSAEISHSGNCYGGIAMGKGCQLHTCVHVCVCVCVCVCVGAPGRYISQTVTLMGRCRFKRGQKQGS